ncbi:HNH endonuclease [Pseudonocardia parietis]|uniref:HNH nuclease domain-containing protein n=1 Tax=Pseudonocardia parietis TaxID=570936 RepID=A0ABS4VMZ0_9PSEU|nr:HNH endonuclease signature motif containing protein [Pseudonocardia parietis]MBP2365302.1 hypothetical protein [Pseudonocardia parietis]
MVIAIDPDAARRHYQKALGQRRVICYLDEDGTATLSIIGLDPTAAQAACERLDGLARDLRAAGHPEPLPAIRADLSTALLDGSLHTLSHDDIVAVMLARATAPDPEAGTGTVPATGDGLSRHDARDSSDADSPDSGSNGDGGGGGDDGDDGDDGGDGGDGRTPEPARTGIEIRLRLSTLLGHDDHPGEIPGIGPVLAPTARACAARQQHAEWRFAITDPDGRLVLAGTTRRRPPTAPAHPLFRQAHGGTVELQIPATQLEQPAGLPPPGWEPLIADLVAQYTRRDELRAALDERPDDRLPHPALRRHVEIRDRTCCFVGCRRPARKAQQDHTWEHQHGGPTVTENLGPLCVLHHAIKTAGRWRVHQPEPGVFRWRSPLGRVYCTRGEPVCPPLPDPLPEAQPEGFRPAPPVPSRLQREIDDLPLYPPAAPEPDVADPATAAPPERAPPADPPF